MGKEKVWVNLTFLITRLGTNRKNNNDQIKLEKKFTQLKI